MTRRSLDVPRFRAVAAASIAVCCACSDRQALPSLAWRGDAASVSATTSDPGEAIEPCVEPSCHAPVGQGDVDAAPGQPYANVVSATVTGSNGALRFSVTVESSDVDCSQFADWWEVLGSDGALLYRRTLNHSHTDANGTTDTGAPGNTFTRDGGPVPTSWTTSVIVRAHMSRSGYHGQVLRGSAAAGFAANPTLPAEFAADVEAAPPQPGECAF